VTFISDIFAPRFRSWEDFYRNRWSYDKIVRSTHGVNCTGGCSWNIYVKQGIVTWEMQALDYPKLDRSLPTYEPRGCQRGISYSWYVYSPLRVKYPYVRGVLFDLWEKAKAEHANDPVAAWRAVVTEAESRRAYQSARGKGGFRRVSWPEILELIAAANIYTINEHGPDRIIGFSPIPAMSMVSYAAGARFLQLMGGVCLSFYDWYCDLPPASPEIWGEQTDVAESADWFHSEMIAVVGSNVLMTRTPDAHFLVEARHRGTRVIVFAPDFSQTAKVADEWVPLHQGQDGAFWMAVAHVILREFFVERQVPYFLDYLKRYSDLPFLVKLEPLPSGGYRAGALLRAADLEELFEEQNADFKFCMLDEADASVRTPGGTVGHRWQDRPGQWNLDLKDARTGAPIAPALRLGGLATDKIILEVDDFSNGEPWRVQRSVAAREIQTREGSVLCTLGLELLLATYGISDEKASDESGRDYADASQIYTPAWQERFTGVSADLVVRFAREWARTAERTQGRCSIIMGAGANHWYHNNLVYRSCIVPLILCGCVGKNGGGWNHYVGQEKLAPAAPWASIAFATDWGAPPRLQNTPSFHYVHSDQWRYDGALREMCPVSTSNHPVTSEHTMDQQVRAVRAGWLPCYPQFDRSNFRVLAEAARAGCQSPESIRDYVVEQLKQRKLRFSMEDPDNPASYPRLWYIWRGNALQASAKGHEYFLRHYLGTHSSAIADEVAQTEVKQVVWHDQVELGKIDLVVDLNFRMDTSALYSDIVLPAATYYEKDDLNTTDLHTFVHPLQAAVPPCWEARSDWAIFSDIAQQTSRMAEAYLPEPLTDVVLSPLAHDSPAEMAQPRVLDWMQGQCEAVPGKTMPNVTLVTRHYPSVYQKFISLGRAFRDHGIGAHGLKYSVADQYDAWLASHPTETWGENVYPSLRADRSVCEVILGFAAETNGELAFRAFEGAERKTGRSLKHLAESTRAVRTSFQDIVSAPRRVLTTPYWTGNITGGRTYSAFCQNIEELIPWRTLTGRQHLYLDHEFYRAYGEHLPTYKPRADLGQTRDIVKTDQAGSRLILNYLTPHGKWHIHSTYGDTLRMETLSRGIEPIWLNDEDAESAGIGDNDWVEITNDHGAVVTRACVSARLPRGMCFIYHATERTVGVPRAPSRELRRAGGHNSLTRTRLKPLFMIGGYGQFSYGFNYWGPQGVNRDTFVVVRKLSEVVW
jgi:nitrate reductase alpha subunit